jgi:hypothetical protein
MDNMNNAINKVRHLTSVARRLQLRRAGSDEALRLRKELLEEALDEAKETLEGIGSDEGTWQGQEARACLLLIKHMLKGTK